MTRHGRDRNRAGWVAPATGGLRPPPAPAADPRRRAAKTATFAVRLDEAAALLHPVAPARVVVNTLGGLLGLLILPWTDCVAWVAGGLVIEAWAWFASRPQARGQPIGWGARANFIANYLAINLWWLLLAVLFWRAGTLAGEASGAVMFLALCFIAVMLFYGAPVAFLAAGAAPAIGAMTMIALADGRDWRQLAPIWLTLGLTGIFNLGRALDAPSVQQQKRWLADSLNDYELLADNITDVIARIDLAGVYYYVSPASLSVLGYRPDELVGTRLRELVHPESAATMMGAFSRLVRGAPGPEEVTARLRHKDGRWLWLQTNASAVHEHGVVTGVIGVSRDVTERMAADIALREAKAEAEAANRAKAEFLANVSHEIRTPMNGVLGALHLLDRENISPEGRELMRRANDCGRMLSQLLNDVLDFSKIEAGQLDLAPEPLHVGDALEAVIMLLGDQARAKGVELRCEITGADLWIEADPVRLQQAMFNLVGNAVKFTGKGHVTARLAVSDRGEGRRHVRFEVEDTGIGMTPEVSSHLFERFRQAEADTARRFGGTGLGLSITRALVHMMGGEIDFTSVDGEGSTFWLSFDAPAASPVAAEAVADGMLGGVSVLLVDDNSTNRLVARTMLTRLGAQVEEAEDGVTGLAAARLGAHDLILMDIQMPHMDGLEATRAIRGLRGDAARVPIIGLTANAMAHQRLEYLAAGMNGVVAKPISPTELLGEITRLMAPQETELAG